ncbi:MAG TPA: hypothetical protein VFY14_05725 [Streptomyces sp.]|nr:hypothetical protein [Streptomyces sp.]
MSAQIGYDGVNVGDELTVVVSVEKIRSVGGNDIITTRGEIATTDGEPVATAHSTLVSRAPDA